MLHPDTSMKVVKGSGRGLASGTIPVCPEERRKIARTPRLRAGGVGAKGRTRHLLYMTTVTLYDSLLGMMQNSIHRVSFTIVNREK